MNNVRLSGFALALLTVLTVTACSDPAAAPTSPSSSAASLTLTAEALAGTWSLSSMQAAGGIDQARPANATYTVSFADGRIAVRADCNVCSGVATISSDAVSIGAVLACTRAACPTMAFESAFTTLLAGDHGVTVGANMLALTSARGALRFHR